ncbi:uncharacterized protein LOC129599429 isoform X2 [Paramacrobiotus metropolitanus]|uniref:uncharacterized protein LOC129599429 isoform X2 n=1 Tax=Paramacrobiotus metropolitanus TaxID=2943436 RepID=UPI00244632C0|nr:uncharacterized protein LOC129599429 isoform X2 [Paramacrobiotus metropolitanus]
MVLKITVISALFKMEMDFSEPISAAEWINRQLSRPGAKENFEGYTSELVSNLQLHLYKTQQALDDMASQMPRLSSAIARQLPPTHSALSYIVADIQHLEANLQAHAAATSDVAERIRATEMVKQRMELTYRALENQDNWEALIANVHDVIANGDLDAIVARLVALQKCFISLSGAANYDNRREQLQDVKNRIESVLIPRLISVLSSMEPWRVGSGTNVVHGSESLALKIISVFTTMERKDALKRVLNECRLKQMVKHWDDTATTALQQSDEADTASFDECFAGFCDDLLSSWHNQYRLFAATFSDPTAALLDHYRMVFTETRPKMERQLENAWNKARSSNAMEDFLSMSLNIRHSQDVFCKSLEKDLPDHLHTELCEKLWEDVRHILSFCLKHYAEAEKHLLMTEIDRAHLDVKEKGKSTHALSSAGNRIGNTIYTAVVRCFQLTNGHLFQEIEDTVLSAVKIHCTKVSLYAKKLENTATSEYNVDSADGNYELLNDFVKVLQHFGDLLVQLHNITESLPHNAASQSHAATEDTGHHPFAKVVLMIKESANAVFQEFYSVLLQPVDKLLENIPTLPSWTTGSAKGGIDIPSFGLDPQEHVTRIGNYLLTLPQALDPLLSSESASMKALKSIISFPGSPSVDDSLSLAEVAIQGAMYLAMEKIVAVLLKIRHLTSFGLKQLVCDLKYIQNIAEDFATSPSTNFETLRTLLTIPVEEFEEASPKFPGSMVAFASRARNIV